MSSTTRRSVCGVAFALLTFAIPTKSSAVLIQFGLLFPELVEFPVPIGGNEPGHAAGGGWGRFLVANLGSQAFSLTGLRFGVEVVSTDIPGPFFFSLTHNASAYPGFVLNPGSACGFTGDFDADLGYAQSFFPEVTTVTAEPRLMDFEFNNGFDPATNAWGNTTTVFRFTLEGTGQSFLTTLTTPDHQIGPHTVTHMASAVFTLDLETPIDQVPEPASVFLLIGGTIVLVLLKRT